MVMVQGGYVHHPHAQVGRELGAPEQAKDGRGTFSPPCIQNIRVVAREVAGAGAEQAGLASNGESKQAPAPVHIAQIAVTNVAN